jgi:peptide-methionine (S)-S-oxide reductase
MATFGAGCFWGVEAVFRGMDGVVEATSGYSGGHTGDPSYGDVCSGGTGHAEVVEVVYDPEKVSYEELLEDEELLEAFWASHNPTTRNRQGFDFGSQYRSAIFFHTPEQEVAAHASKEKAQVRFRRPIITEITPASEFYRAEEYHQRYFEKNRLARFFSL